jgi:predicted component of type VI protein secretion system
MESFLNAQLVVLNGKQKDRAIPLPLTVFLIGRDSKCHLRPHCERVSKLHCAISVWAGRVRVRDLNSRNGTLLNGRRICGEVAVEDGDRLQVGTLTFAFKIKHEQGAAFRATIHEGEVRWLLEAAQDPAALLLPHSTVATPDGAPEASPAGAETNALSAGEHLRDLFDRRRHRPNAGADNEPGKGG